MSVFALLTPTPCPAKNSKNQNFEKMKKLMEISHLHMCTKNHNHMRYGFWDWVRQTNCFVLLDHFLPFYPPNNPENQNFQNMKKAYEDVIMLYMCPKITIIWCMLPHSWVQHTIFCHFGSIFAFLPHYWPQKLKTDKNKEIFPFSQVHNK